LDKIMAGVDFDTLRSEITMEQVLNKIGFKPSSRSGDQWHGPCPVHGSSSPQGRSVSVNLKSGRYYCHKCHSHGNQLELWAAVHQLSIYDAALDLCRTLGRQIPWIKRW
jgi:DNA primase